MDVLTCTSPSIDMEFHAGIGYWLYNIMEHPNPKRMNDLITPLLEKAILAKYIGKLPALIVTWAGACSAVLLAVSQIIDILIKLHILKS